MSFKQSLIMYSLKLKDARDGTVNSILGKKVCHPVDCVTDLDEG